MNTKYIILLGVLMCTYACKDVNKSEKTLVEDDVAIDSLTTKSFCTQMPLYNAADAFLYAYEKEKSDDTKGGFSDISVDNFMHWQDTSWLMKQDLYKQDTIKAIFQKSVKAKVMFNFYQIDAAIIHDAVWPYNHLKVKFIDGTKVLHDRVMLHAVEWEKWCAVKFEVVNSGDADITISFNKDGFWSYVGQESLNHIPSMSLTGIENESAIRFRSTVLHEFGHALGLVHEHQSPNFVLVWDKPKVYEYYARTQNWTQDEIDDNIFYRYNFGQYNRDDATQFDPLSIMIYEIPSWMLKNSQGISFNENHELSILDKQLIKTKYY